MSDDRSDLEEAIRLLRKKVCAPEFWETADLEACAKLFMRHPEKPKLLPCPFCGGSDLRVPHEMSVICNDCGGQVRSVSSKDTWNRRAKPASGPLSGGKPE